LANTNSGTAQHVQGMQSHAQVGRHSCVICHTLSLCYSAMQLVSCMVGMHLVTFHHGFSLLLLCSSSSACMVGVHLEAPSGVKKRIRYWRQRPAFWQTPQAVDGGKSNHKGTNMHIL
jgi:hypothetical protein